MIKKLWNKYFVKKSLDIERLPEPEKDVTPEQDNPAAQCAAAKASAPAYTFTSSTTTVISSPKAATLTIKAPEQKYLKSFKLRDIHTEKEYVVEGRFGITTHTFDYGTETLFELYNGYAAFPLLFENYQAFSPKRVGITFAPTMFQLIATDEDDKTTTYYVNVTYADGFRIGEKEFSVKQLILAVENNNLKIIRTLAEDEVFRKFLQEGGETIERPKTRSRISS